MFKDECKGFKEVIDTAVETSKEKNVILLLCGNSGSGKSTFESKLFKRNSDKFFKLPQCTTRDKRPYEKLYDYYFISKETYDKISSTLIARIRGKSFNGTCYGTIPVFSKNKVNTCIASYEAIDDIMDIYQNNSTILKDTEIYALYFEIDYENLRVKREGRDESFIKKEQTELINSLGVAKEQGIINEIGYWKYEDNDFRFPDMEDVDLRE